MRGLSLLHRLVAQIRVAPDPTPPTSARPQPAAPPLRPSLAPAAPPLMQIEQRLLDRFWPQMRDALQAELVALADAEHQGGLPLCCGIPMATHDRRPVTCQTWRGTIRIPARRYRCRRCKRDCRPLVDQLELEPGRPCAPVGCSRGGWDYWAAWRPTLAIRLEKHGYQVWTQTIPARITPKNRLLVGAPLSRADATRDEPETGVRVAE